jgi:hypothetical protein
MIIAAGALLYREDGTQHTRLPFLLLAAIPTALMIGLRWQIGPDWENYLDQFNYSRLYSFMQGATHGDPGYFVLNWLMHRVDAPFWVLNFCCGAIFVAGLTAFCRRQPNPWLAFLVAFPYLVLVVAMSGNRQSVALGFMFFALNDFEQRRLNRFAVLTVFAALFHSSVLLMVPLCLLSYTRSGLQRAVLLLVAAALAYYFFQESFSIYARRYSVEKIQSTGVVYRLAMNGLAAILFLLFQGRFALNEHQTRLWRNISVATLVLIGLVLVVPSSTAVDRFLLYLFPLQFVVLSRLPKLLSGGRGGEGQLTLLVVGYAALVQATFLLFGTYASSYIPYRSIFQA